MYIEDLTIILPAYNEEKAIGLVINEIWDLPLDCRILVGDNASSDRTYSVVKSKGIIPVRIRNKGKGNVVQVLLKRVETPYVIMVNSDYTYPMEYLQTIYSLLKMNRYDVVVGCRQLKEKGSMSSANTLGNFLLSLLASILYRYRVNDVCSGMWGFRRGVLDRFNITSRDFTLEADLFINSVKNRCKIYQIPIGYRPRLDGSKAKLRVWDGFKIGWFLIKRKLK